MAREISKCPICGEALEIICTPLGSPNSTIKLINVLVAIHSG